MEVREFGPDDRELLRAFVEVTNAVRAADSPWVHPMTEREADGTFRHGWDGEPGLPFVALAGGAPVGCARYHVSLWDNQHLAWLDVAVHPACRRQGHGTAMLEAMVAAPGARAGPPSASTAGRARP